MSHANLALTLTRYCLALGLFYKILFHFEAFVHNIMFFANSTPFTVHTYLFIVQCIAQYYKLLHPPARF